ncbi:triosephosphate isomerase [Raineyella antarctica]|uniref:Triosephosphate isomerase n=1 Tax=Raineyella antarctica TaxID=1577474 RepID=A0A1G6GED4_9ACTN|nr:triose-phosphate isomerase [Raineyella antarctica]SDB80193.1 triosephosphate isomerase [Raineyella antarctica]
MTRKPLMAGNWKMNLDHFEATSLVQKLAWALADADYDSEKSECVVLTPFTDIRSVQTLIESDKLPLGFGAQDVSAHDSGAYTGEVSATMLQKLNCSYVTVGHSERREYHAETDEIVNAKSRKVIEAGMTPIVCVGEGLDIRKEGRQVEYTVAQVEGAFAGWSAEEVAQVVVAYEPVWAIGTGEVATPEDAQEVCAAIRASLGSSFGADVADTVRVLYGGSVKASNVKEIMAQPDVDGALVGGASLKAEDFTPIVTFYA